MEYKNLNYFNFNLLFILRKIILVVIVNIFVFFCFGEVYAKDIKTYYPVVIATYPHDNTHFTQGLFFYENKIYETTGLYNNSKIYIKDAKSGEVIFSRSLGNSFFAEGATLAWNKIYCLTWKEETAFIFDPSSLKLLSIFKYQGEGWGLTFDGQRLIRSDGTSKLYFYDEKGQLIGEPLKITRNGLDLKFINELEWLENEQLLLANLWQKNEIVAIDLSLGEVVYTLDLSALIPQEQKNNSNAVANGIAYNSKRGTLWLTGKLWPVMYEIKWPPF